MSEDGEEIIHRFFFIIIYPIYKIMKKIGISPFVKED
jgi:hypothetical protein